MQPHEPQWHPTLNPLPLISSYTQAWGSNVTAPQGDPIAARPHHVTREALLWS